MKKYLLILGTAVLAASCSHGTCQTTPSTGSAVVPAYEIYYQCSGLDGQGKVGAKIYPVEAPQTIGTIKGNKVELSKQGDEILTLTFTKGKSSTSARGKESVSLHQKIGKKAYTVDCGQITVSR
jgi:hypothetical protein